MLVQLAFAIALSMLSAALAPRPEPPRSASAGSIEAPKPPIGRSVFVIFGEVWIKDLPVTYFGNKKRKPIRRSSGGKK